MLTPRNFISVTIVIAVFSILSVCWSMLQPPDSGGIRADSYGTRGNGYRALFETLDELNVPVRRLLVPPVPEEFPNSLLVLWSPRVDLINADPTWLNKVEVWLKDGGQAVVTFDSEPQFSFQAAFQRAGRLDRDEDDSARDDLPTRGQFPTPSTLFQLLGVGDLHITRVEEEGTEEELDENGATARDKSKPFLSDDELVDTLKEVLTASSRPEETRVHTVEATGAFAELVPAGSEIELPLGLLYSIDVSDRDLTDTLLVVTEDGKKHCIAARIPVGRGHVTVVSTRRLISNENLPSADNVVVASALLLSSGKEIVFDEFYHGATIRGNPMWLFSQRTYGLLTGMLLLLLGVAIWRAAVFLGPPVTEAATQRRSIQEYVDAMSRFVREGKGHSHWSLERVRDGVLWKLRREFGLPPESHDASRLTAVISRKDPRRAERLIEVLKETDQVLTMPASAGERRIALLIQRMTACLSKTDTTRSVPKLRK